MKALHLSALLCTGLTLSAGAIDLTPHYISHMTEGVVVRRPYFADGGKKYGIKLDAETSLTAYEGGAMFRFEKFPEATMRLRSSTVPAQTGFAPETFELYRQAALALLPPGVTAVEIIGNEADAYPINGWSSLRLTFSYRANNFVRRQSVTFLNLKPNEQIVIQTAASENNFEEVTARAFNIIRRWHEIVPEEEQPYS